MDERLPNFEKMIVLPRSFEFANKVVEDGKTIIQFYFKNSCCFYVPEDEYKDDIEKIIGNHMIEVKPDIYINPKHMFRFSPMTDLFNRDKLCYETVYGGKYKIPCESEETVIDEMREIGKLLTDKMIEDHKQGKECWW